VCGLVGLKPTIGEISTRGIVPLSSTLDHVGPLCLSVEDAAIVYDVLRGATSEEHERAEPRHLRLGVLPSLLCSIHILRLRSSARRCDCVTQA
jgi:aspartyl-tRNA(Asn)/glutamyl-tRNA(Gln) amidotransferase subunit A